MKTIVFKYGQMTRFLSSPECRWSQNTVRGALRGDIHIEDCAEIRKLAEAFIERENRDALIKSKQL